MKIVFVLSLAKYLQFRKNYRRLRGLLGPFVLTLVPMFLILPEPDLGTVILLLPVLFVMLLAAGARIRHFLLILTLGLCAVPVVWLGMKDYQRGRIAALLLQNEWFRDAAEQGRFERIGLATAEQARLWAYTTGFQIIRSKAALGSGGLTGQGFDAQSVVLRDPYLPEKHNDFIFAVIGHQWGFIGSLTVILCYVAIAVGGVEIATLTYDPFGRLLAVGVVTLISTQVLINIGMTIGLMPVTGMTLPFVSYGGSSLIVNFVGIGLLVNIAQRRPVVIGPKPFEFVGDD